MVLRQNALELPPWPDEREAAERPPYGGSEAAARFGGDELFEFGGV